VHELAIGKEIRQSQLASAINPLLILNPESVEQVYPNLESLTLGFSTLQSILGSNRVKQNSQIRRYITEILILRKTLSKNMIMQSVVRAGLSNLEPIRPSLIDCMQTNQQEINEQNYTFEEISSLYRKTLSTLKHRIKVAGKVQFLKNEIVSNKIRGLLFAGVRSAVLWHQLDGRYWRLFIYNKRISNTVSDIHQKITTEI
tara:strand:+ start:3887 stop:4489 length:603 start_codon:yes stop_codon:yes gene_type:complete